MPTDKLQTSPSSYLIALIVLMMQSTGEVLVNTPAQNYYREGKRDQNGKYEACGIGVVEKPSH